MTNLNFYKNPNTQIFIKLILKSVFYLPAHPPSPLPGSQSHTACGTHNGLIKVPFACLQLWVPRLSLALTAALSDELIRDGCPQAHIVCHLKAAVSRSGGRKNRLTAMRPVVRCISRHWVLSLSRPLNNILHFGLVAELPLPSTPLDYSTMALPPSPPLFIFLWHLCCHNFSC